LKNNFNTRQRCTGTHTPTLHTPSEDTHVNVAQVKFGQNCNSHYIHRLLQRISQFQGVGNAGVCVNMIYHGPQFDGAGTCFTESVKKRGETAVDRFGLGKTIAKSLMALRQRCLFQLLCCGWQLWQFVFRGSVGDTLQAVCHFLWQPNSVGAQNGAHHLRA
jgi:hypothetical protein